MVEPHQNRLSLSQHVVYICSRALAYSLPLLFFLVTCSFYLKTYDSAQIKITFTQIGGTMLIFLWFTKILVEGRWPFRKADWVYVAPFVAFLISGLIAYAHTSFKGWALEETLRRVFYMFIAIITIAEMRSNERMTRLWRWLLAAAWVAIGYGVLQYIDSRFFTAPATGIDPFIWRQAFGFRVFSTFGNPNFYGNFLVIVTPLIFASILQNKGSMIRPFVILSLTLCLFLVIDNMKLGLLWGYDPSFRVVYGAVILGLLAAFGMTAFGKANSAKLGFFLLLFGFLFLNLYSTETKGAWVGFVAATAVTIFLIFEYFLHMDKFELSTKVYTVFLVTLGSLLGTMLIVDYFAFVKPFLEGQVTQTGFNMLWIFVTGAAFASIGAMVWVIKKPWNLKKLIYGMLIFFILSMGSGVLQYTKTRLLSVSFRVFTWIATWEMVRTSPIIGNGVGTFKVIYPAFRRPQIIVLEDKSNTETDHAEDEYIEIWQDEGIVGFGIFIWLVLTALLCGFKQLRWYSRIRAPDMGRKRKLLEMQSDPRSYEILGFLGAYIGVLIHWVFDVSVRFVSSGIFSGLLPGVLVAYARNHSNPIRNEVRLPYDKWIRLGVAGFWTSALLWLGVELVPRTLITGGDTKRGQIVLFAIIAGALLYVLMEVLEWGLKPEKSVPFADQYPPINHGFFVPRLILLVGVVMASVYGVRIFSQHFKADVHHNLAIFFSKQGIWAKEPQFTSKMMKHPPDIKRKYEKWGGALEHYTAVIRNNPFFPMALYFTGNVYNDRGSQMIVKANEARKKGDKRSFERQYKKAYELWDNGEQAYMRTKKLAPNYVQTHHQMGLLNVKRAEGSLMVGNQEKAKEYYDKAYENFRLYNIIDPVFTPNHDRMVHILLRRGDFKEAERLYKQAIFYNRNVSQAIRNYVYAHQIRDLYASLAKVYYTDATRQSQDPFHPVLPEIEEALKYFKLATEADLIAKYRPRSADPWKGYGFLLEKVGRFSEAQQALREAVKINPKDPELKGKRLSGS